MSTIAQMEQALRAAEKLAARLVGSRSGKTADEAREVLRLVREALPPEARASTGTVEQALAALANVHLQRGLSRGQVQALLVTDMVAKHGWTKVQASRRVGAAIRRALGEVG